MKPSPLSGLTKSAKDFQDESVNSELRIRLGPIARRIVETSDNHSASSVAKLELGIEDLQNRNESLAKQLAQASANSGSVDMSPFVDAILNLNVRFDRSYAQSEERNTEFYGLFSDLNEQIYLLRLLVVMIATNNGAERLDAVKTIEARMTEHQQSVMARTDLNTEKFKEMRAELDERRLLQERALTAGREQSEEKNPEVGKPEKEAERG